MGEAAAFFGENRADGGADHGVAHAHDVDAGDALADVGVDAFEIVKDGFLPVGPIFFEEELAILRGSAVGERPIKGPYGAVDVGAEALVGGVDVAEGWGVEEDGVPGRLGVARIGEAVKGEIGGEPGGVDEIVERREIFDEIGSEEGGSGEDGEVGVELGFAGEDLHAAGSLRDAMDHLIGADVFADAFDEATGDPAIAFGPGKRTFFFLFA